MKKLFALFKICNNGELRKISQTKNNKFINGRYNFFNFFFCVKNIYACDNSISIQFVKDRQNIKKKAYSNSVI